MVTIVEPDPEWASEFDLIAARLLEAAPEGVARIDHIGSTSVPGLPAKNIIDVQVTVVDDEALEHVAAELADHGWRQTAAIVGDHFVPGLSAAPAEWRKVLLEEPEGERRANVHVRVKGRANQRYALLFRDFLRAHPNHATAYANVKRGLALLASDVGSYADAKDPTCDLIYRAAELWAEDEGWTLPEEELRPT